MFVLRALPMIIAIALFAASQALECHTCGFASAALAIAHTVRELPEMLRDIPQKR